MSGWVFGYGSLVSPTSLAATIGRPVAEHDVAVAHLDGYGRRWNYGAKHVRGAWTHEGRVVTDGIMVALGLVSSPESCNGVIVRVTTDELALLDRRERDYDRTDVSDLVSCDVVPGGTIVTYVPRASAVERYETARDEHRAAVRRPYWELVSDAFEALGAQHAALYALTPAPDVPVVDMTVSML